MLVFEVGQDLGHGECPDMHELLHGVAEIIVQGHGLQRRCVQELLLALAECLKQQQPLFVGHGLQALFVADVFVVFFFDCLQLCFADLAVFVLVDSGEHVGAQDVLGAVILVVQLFHGGFALGFAFGGRGLAQLLDVLRAKLAGLFGGDDTVFVAVSQLQALLDNVELHADSLRQKRWCEQQGEYEEKLHVVTPDRSARPTAGPACRKSMHAFTNRERNCARPSNSASLIRNTSNQSHKLARPRHEAVGVNGRCASSQRQSPGQPLGQLQR